MNTTSVLWWEQRWSDTLTSALDYVNKSRRHSLPQKLLDLSAALTYIQNSRPHARVILDDINSLTTAEELADAIELVFNQPAHRLAAYGTLRRGQSNHHVVSDIKGEWMPGFVEGTLAEVAGYPSFTWVPGGEKIPVEVLHSTELPIHIHRIDEFEGSNYVRTLIPVLLDTGLYSVCNIYEGNEGK